MRNLIDGFLHFKHHVYPRERQLFRELGARQNPQALFITCADSRVVPSLIMQSRPGDLFECRTIGNQIPAHGAPEAPGVASAIEYALEALDVRDIIVCGHSDCGAMKAVMNPQQTAALPATQAWLKHAEPARAAATKNYPYASDDILLRAIIEENIVAQLRNLTTHPSVVNKLAHGHLNLHGWFYQIHSGDITAYEELKGVFRPLDALASKGDAA